ncbi:MAG: hypothetical protein NUV31_00945 [Dehalococcoidales bacterium]|jgi:hypothetical protein|nr:hypothetical protein [Dehalococcoidales bacterium]
MHSYKVLLSLAMVLIICSLWLLRPTTEKIEADETMNNLRMNMKSYGNHDTFYDSRILTIRPEWVIDNPPHGLYGEMESPQYTAEWLLQNIAAYHAAGIKIAGYISSGYEGRGGADGYASKWYSLEMNKKLITNMATLDKIDGVFIDECSAFPNTNQKEYLKTLVDLTHSYGMIAWGNTGVDDFSPALFTEIGFDLIQSTENWRGAAQNLSAVQQQFGSRISVTGFSSAYTAEKAFDLTVNAWQRGIRYCYINNVEYTAIAPWFEEYASRLVQVQSRYPISPLVPGVTPTTSNPSPTSTPASTSKPSTTPVISVAPTTSSLPINVAPAPAGSPVVSSPEPGKTTTPSGEKTAGQIAEIQRTQITMNEPGNTKTPEASLPLQTNPASSPALAGSSNTPASVKPFPTPGSEYNDQLIHRVEISETRNNHSDQSGFRLLMVIGGLLILSSIILILTWRFAR